MNYYVYKITNTVNGKFYIGKCENRPITERFKEHLNCARTHNYKRSHLYEAMNHYGYENFIIEVISEYPDQKSCQDAEKALIKFLHSQDTSIGYNIADGGVGGNTHYQYKGMSAHKPVRSVEDRQKQSNTLKEGYASGRLRGIKGYTWKVSKPRTKEMNEANSKRNKGMFYVYNPITDIETKIQPEQAEEYEANGWILHKRKPGTTGGGWNKRK